jgi:hypothetical protein
VFPKESACLLKLAASPDQWCQLHRQVDLVERPQRRKVPAAELVETQRPAQVLQPVLAEVAELDARLEKVMRCP